MRRFLVEQIHQVTECAPRHLAQALQLALWKSTPAKIRKPEPALAKTQPVTFGLVRAGGLLAAAAVASMSKRR